MYRPLVYCKKTLPWIILAILISYFWIDRPLAEWAYNWFPLLKGKGGETDYALLATQLLYCAMLPLFLIYYYYHDKGVNTKLINCIGLMCVSSSIAFFVKTALQFFFGRIAPRYSLYHVLNFVRNPNLYGFHLLEGGSFPSGHMAFFSSALFAIVLFYPTWRYVVAYLLLILASLLLFLGYHFFSDVIAGTYLGISITLAIYYLNYKKVSSF